jgi:glycosyltransferase involved in cell wall biosynthesis
MLHGAACLRALCPPEVDSFRAYGLKNPVAVVPNGVDLPSLGELPPRHPSLPEGRKVLLYLGRIHDKKGLAQLVSAWGQIKNPAKKDWILAIAGWDQGGHEAELKRQAGELGSADVLFLGPQFGADKAACYASCDAFILPSFSEGLPMVVLEAWAYAKPVLMTPACNLPEGFTTGAALQISPTVKGIQFGLHYIFDMPASELEASGAEGRRLVESKFDWRLVAAQMAEVYAWVLGGGAKPACVV